MNNSFGTTFNDVAAVQGKLDENGDFIEVFNPITGARPAGGNYPLNIVIAEAEKDDSYIVVNVSYNQIIAGFDNNTQYMFHVTAAMAEDIYWAMPDADYVITATYFDNGTYHIVAVPITPQDEDTYSSGRAAEVLSSYLDDPLYF